MKAFRSILTRVKGTIAKWLGTKCLSESFLSWQFPYNSLALDSQANVVS